MCSGIYHQYTFPACVNEPLPFSMQVDWLVYLHTKASHISPPPVCCSSLSRQWHKCGCHWPTVTPPTHWCIGTKCVLQQFSTHACAVEISWLQTVTWCCGVLAGGFHLVQLLAELHLSTCLHWRTFANSRVREASPFCQILLFLSITKKDTQEDYLNKVYLINHHVHLHF